MSRSYHLYRLQNEEKAREIEHAVMSLDGVESVKISCSLDQILVSAADDRFSQVMDRLVNVCKKLAPDSEVSYMF